MPNPPILLRGLFFQPESKTLAFADRIEVAGARFPKVDLVDACLPSEEIKPIIVRVADKDVDHLAPRVCEALTLSPQTTLSMA